MGSNAPVSHVRRVSGDRGPPSFSKRDTNYSDRLEEAKAALEADGFRSLTLSMGKWLEYWYQSKHVDAYQNQVGSGKSEPSAHQIMIVSAAVCIG